MVRQAPCGAGLTKPLAERQWASRHSALAVRRGKLCSFQLKFTPPVDTPAKRLAEGFLGGRAEIG